MASLKSARLCSRPKSDYVLIPMAEFLRKCPKAPERPSDDPCAPKILPAPIPEPTCPPMNVYMRKKQTIKSPWPKPNFKGSLRLGDYRSNIDTFVAQTWPMKFRVRRMLPRCNVCERDLYYREIVTDNQDLLLLSECCNVEIYPKKKLDCLHRVPVGVITGPQKFTKRTLTETLYDPCKKVEPVKPPPPPPPEPPKVEFVALPVSKKKKKKKKAEPKVVKRNTVTVTRKKTYRVHEYEIHHSAEEVKERKLREAMERGSLG